MTVFDGAMLTRRPIKHPDEARCRTGHFACGENGAATLPDAAWGGTKRRVLVIASLAATNVISAGAARAVDAELSLPEPSIYVLAPRNRRSRAACGASSVIRPSSERVGHRRDGARREPDCREEAPQAVISALRARSEAGVGKTPTRRSACLEIDHAPVGLISLDEAHQTPISRSCRPRRHVQPLDRGLSGVVSCRKRVSILANARQAGSYRNPTHRTAGANHAWGAR